MAPGSDTPGPGRHEMNLPDVVDITMRRVPFKPPQYKYFRSALADHKEAIEFMVRLTGPVPIRALGPALFIGGVQVTEAEKVEETLYRFLAFNIKQLEAGAPIAFGWDNAKPAQRKETQFRFTLR